MTNLSKYIVSFIYFLSVGWPIQAYVSINLIRYIPVVSDPLFMIFIQYLFISKIFSYLFVFAQY